MAVIIVAFVLGIIAGVFATLAWALCAVKKKDKEDDPDDMEGQMRLKDFPEVMP